MDDSKDYNYETAGLDGFLSRSIDNLSQVTLDSPGPVSTAVAYDRAQVTGPLGNVLRIGNINLDGINGRISVFDANGNEVIRIGELDG